jgi:4-hydroxy-tetrahydrodipicolinate reductase
MKICIIGCSGRMGRELVKGALEQPEKFSLYAGVVSPHSQHIGKDIGEFVTQNKSGVLATDKIPDKSEMVIDFSTKEATLSHADFCARHHIPYISGVTGLTHEQLQLLESYSQKAPMLYSPNMSIQVNFLSRLVEQTARFLDDSFDIEILDMHHNQKLDAPSGTTLLLGQAAARGRKINLNERLAIERSGKRRKGDIGVAVIRAGDVGGEHRVMFAGQGERIELAHINSKRNIFAHGALKAAEWLIQQKPGRLYNIQDMF